MEDVEEDQKDEKWPGIILMEWCREYIRIRIEKLEKEVRDVR